MIDLKARSEDSPRPKPDGESKQEMLANDPLTTVAVGTNMDPEVRVNLVILQRENADVFAFSGNEMSRIDPNLMIHRLNFDSATCSVKQKKMNFSSEKNKAYQRRS